MKGLFFDAGFPLAGSSLIYLFTNLTYLCLLQNKICKTVYSCKLKSLSIWGLTKRIQQIQAIWICPWPSLSFPLSFLSFLFEVWASCQDALRQQELKERRKGLVVPRWEPVTGPGFVVNNRCQQGQCQQPDRDIDSTQSAIAWGS